MTTATVDAATKPKVAPRVGLYSEQLKAAIRQTFGLTDRRSIRSYLKAEYSLPVRINDELREAIGQQAEAKLITLATRFGMDARVTEVAYALEIRCQFRHQGEQYGDRPSQEESLFTAPVTDPMLEARGQRNGLLLVVPKSGGGPAPVAPITDLITAMGQALRGEWKAGARPLQGPKEERPAKK